MRTRYCLGYPAPAASANTGRRCSRPCAHHSLLLVSPPLFSVWHSVFCVHYAPVWSFALATVSPLLVRAFGAASARARHTRYCPLAPDAPVCVWYAHVRVAMAREYA
ncbi:hypothetical protein C8R47DRAFT_1228240 [Mycena vitilis]|nr:hypothetical protein C8R47DRAFT_1228240 [Mycena vitilis]